MTTFSATAASTSASRRQTRLDRLGRARLYLCTGRRVGFAAFLDAVLAGADLPAAGDAVDATATATATTASAGAGAGAATGIGPGPAAAAGLGVPEAATSLGVDIVQLREKNLEWAAEAADLAVVRGRTRARSALVSANDRADLATFTGVDVLHGGQDDIPPALARKLVGRDVLIGRSTHDARQLADALEDPDVDYFCVGPVWATPTKAGRPGVGLGMARLAARLAPPFESGAKPWFVTGGIDETTLDEVLGTGARRVVVVRGITDSAEPGAAAGRLARRLRDAGGPSSGG